MAETRAIKRLLKNLNDIKAQVITFSNATNIADIKTCLTLLNNEWNEFQALEKMVKGKFDDAHVDSVDAIEATHFDLSRKLIKWETLHGENNAYQANGTMDELMLNQSNFLQQISAINNRDNEVRLPRVNIPAFSGIYAEFPSFKDLFEASIHNNSKMSKVHKLQYLKGLLKGEAYLLINHIAVTEANYEEAWDKIKTRYDKRKHVIHALLRKFLEQPNLNQSCPKSLRHLSDVSDEVIRGLKVLGDKAESRDPWLIYLLVNKLDSDSKEAWAHATVTNDFPTLEELFTFLNKRSDALENLSSIQRVKSNPVKRINSLVSQSSNNTCPLCSGEHYMGRCENYLNLPCNERKKLVAEKKLCFNCLSSNHQSIVCRSRFSCRICRRKHHITLHPETTEESATESNHPTNTIHQTEIKTCNTMLRMRPLQANRTQAILPTASVLVQDKFGETHKYRILLDSGSQSSFITENCVQRLKLQRHKANVRITGVTAGSIVSKGRTVLYMRSMYDSKSQTEVHALIINNLPSRLPSYNIKCEDKRLFRNFELADPEFDKSAPIDILIGADRFFAILQDGQRQFNSLSLQKTIFGWIVSGETQSTIQDSNTSSYMAFNIQLDDTDSTLRKFWELEEVDQAINHSPEDTKCETLFTQTHTRQEDGRYVVRLPFKNSSSKLGNSLIKATQRFLTLERKLASNEDLRGHYIEQMREYITMGHMVEIQQSERQMSDENIFYLPHHSVIKESSDSTKVRIVFDGSCKTNTETSLNDKLMVGPTIQHTLWSTLMRFRAHRIALTADIEKMYRQVIVHPRDTNFQRVLWRENPNQPLRHYKLTRVTFGLACSAFLAIRSLQQLGRDNGDKRIEQHICSDFYVDDLLCGSSDEQSAAEIKRNLTNVLQPGGFTLRKWQSNVSSLNERANSKIATNLCSDDTEIIKILGLQWYPVDDTLTFKVSPERTGQITKRKIISESARVFDPLGFLSPSIILLKIIFQKLWLLKLDWDDKLPDYFEREYRKIRSEFEYFEKVKIPRFTNHYQNIELHGFADAINMSTNIKN